MKNPARRSRKPDTSLQRSHRAGHRWMVVGALAASAAVSGRAATPVQAHSRGVSPRPAPSPADHQFALPPEFRISVPDGAPWRWLADLDPSGVAMGWEARPVATTPQDPPPVRQFDIPAGPIATVIARFERETGIHVTLASQGIGTLPSPGVSGLLSAPEALTRLLTGTGVGYTFTTPEAVSLAIDGVAESIDVTASRPRVAAARYARPVSETPQTIQVIPRQVMEAQGVTTLSEALRNVPGISLQAGEGGGASNTTGDMFNLRGFSANNSLFVDGVRDDGLISRDVFNLEQVEVFLGPTGTDVGRGTAAGYVNMTTKAPHLQSLYGGTLGLGTSEQKRATVDLNQALPFGDAGSWWRGTAIRLNALVQESGVPGRDLVTLESRAVAPSLALGLGRHTRATIAGQFVRQDNLPDYGVPAAAWPDGPLTPTGSVASRPVDQRTFFGSPAHDSDRVSQDSYTGRFEQDLGGSLQLRHQVRHNTTHRTAIISTVQSPASYDPLTEQVTIARQGNERENRVTSNQTTVLGSGRTGTLRHALTGTLEITRESQFAPALAGLGTRPSTSIYSPDPFAPVTGVDIARSGAFTDGRTSTLALSIFDAIDLTDRLQVSGGLRWERYDTQYVAATAAGDRTADLSSADSLVSGKVGVLYKLADHGNAYLSFGTVKTPPGTANFTLSTQPNNQNHPNVAPQESTNVEIGSKWDFYGGRLALTGAAFHTINRNVIYTVDASAVPPIFNQDDEQRVNGISLGLAGRIHRNWDVTANLAYLDSENRSQNAATAGRRLTLTPEFSGSVWTTYTLPLGLTVGGGIRLMDDVFVNAANTIRVPRYQLVDAMATYAVTRQLSLRLNVYNLTDEVYIRNINNNGGRYNPGHPRTAVLTASVSF